jgi:hypothetical protein
MLEKPNPSAESLSLALTVLVSFDLAFASDKKEVALNEEVKVVSTL